MSVIHHGDNLEIMRGMESETIDLVATDPPFNTGRDFGAYIDAWKWSGDRLKEFDTLDSTIREVIDVIDRVHSESMAAFCCFLSVRLVEMHRILKPSGSIYQHCDDTASHYIKACLDGIFGARNFRNEIVWQRTASHNDARKKLGRIGDRLLVFAKEVKEQYYCVQYSDNDSEYIKKAYCHDDDDGRGLYKRECLGSPSVRPNLMYEYDGYQPPIKGWAVQLSTMKRMDAEGRLYKPKDKTKRMRRKTYLSEAKGKPLCDIWTDIPNVSGPVYATEKPLALLERIIDLYCPKGGVVLDPFCGSGTTLEAAKRLGRIPIGIDIGKDAIDIATKRLDRDFFGNIDLFEDQ